MIKKLTKFSTYPYLKCNFSKVNYPTHFKDNFKKTYDNLPFDPYISNQTRQRRYANYIIEKIDSDQYSILHTFKDTFKQNVEDSRKEEREFELLEAPYNDYVMQFLMYSADLLQQNHSFNKINVDLHQVRQICYPNVESHNSLEGVHQDGCDYIISALVLNRFNVVGGHSSVFNNKKEMIYETLLKEDELLFQCDKTLYHYITPIEYLSCDSIAPHGYRDILGLDINIIK